ncbi:CubicO group peptidase (beta-lactamase class C family) [Saonia flava]|uniref:CubicO group peptidase (Beta-lactamase class C family) n=1 Tax=Saonia flava TaxID=523696 RepID=A0A846QZN8_9FLAO|nr:serine hydrolase [Saonia flava]NJB72122.1 CubicO group peptidase (beta-lactamase class C family) [Saonia flava]
MINFKIVGFLGVMYTLTSCGQGQSNKITDITKSDGIISPLHEVNIGKIVFIPNMEYQESDFLETFELSPSNDLNISAFLNNSLTNYLHQLAPDLTIEELHKKGNYQFSFLIDGELIYKENLNFGAGLPEQKNKQTILTIPLQNEHLGYKLWSSYMWDRFFYRNGGEAALKTGNHILKIEIRPYLESKEIIIGDLIAEGELKLKLGEPEKATEEQVAIQPIKPYKGWEISKEDYDRERIRALNRDIAEYKFKKITSIVVVKNGKLIVEEYFNGANRSTQHNTRSVGKSFASTVTGIAIGDGYLKSENQSLAEFYDLTQYKNYSAKKDSVTLKSLLTMSSGFDANDFTMDSPGNEEYMYPTDNWVKFALDLPMDKTKIIGKNWDYFTAGVVVLGDILDKSVPGGLEKYTHEKLFKPLGITNYTWQYTPQKVANTAGGLQMNSLDYAKYGQLYRNGGKWEGNQILPESWVKASMTKHFMEKDDKPSYGYLFWNQSFKVNNKTYETFFSSGNGGNKIFFFTDQPLVVVITATAYGEAYAHPQANQIMQDYILPAMLE